MFILLFFAFLAGILTVLSPCILPILPALLAAGTTKGTLRPIGIVLGLVISFTFFTLALTSIVHATGLSPNSLRYAAVVLISLFGLVMIFPSLSNLFAKLTAPVAEFGNNLNRRPAYRRASLTGGILFGAALGLLWTPCAGPILAAITTLVATQSINTYAVLLTLTYGLGAALPMLLIAYGSDKLIHSSKYFSAHAEGIRQTFGGMMILAALAIAFNWDAGFQQRISNYLPAIMVEDNPTVRQELAQLQKQNHTFGAGSYTPGQLPTFGQAPEFVGLTNWINSPPLTMKELKGKVVLIDFWTYTCINCLRTLPYIKQWDKDYKDKGLVIIGVHTPEFEFEKEPQNVADAVKRLGINYPVAQDNEYKTWLAYANQYWPAHYLIDQAGNVRMVHFGEGGYVETENAIRQLLGLAATDKTEPVTISRDISPETYLGTQRGHSYTSEITPKPNESTKYTYTKPLDENQVGLKGPWTIESERITSDSDDSYLDYNFLAKQVYLVLAGSSRTPIDVFLDGKKVSQITVDGDRKYDIVDTTYGRHLLSLKIPKGISAYAFTFGDEK